MESNSEIQRTVSTTPLSVSRVFKSEYQKEGTLSAELRQAVNTTAVYPSKRVSNSLEDNLFSAEDFGFSPGETYTNTENRVAWIDVPEGMTAEKVAEQLKKFANSCLYRILDNRPILSDSDQYAVDNADYNTSLDTIANNQAVRYPEGHSQAGQLALDQFGKVQYRRVAFSKTAKADVDNRTSDMDYGYVSPELAAETNGTSTKVEGQEIGKS